MIASERRRMILSSLNSRGIISLKDMASELGVAEITVRRDVEKLEQEGKLKRVQGGAASLDESDGAELTMQKRTAIHAKEKAAIAQYASSLVQEGESVFLDGGTTMVPLAAILLKRNVNIITYNTMLLSLSTNPVAHIFLVGGEFVPYYRMNVGLMAQDQLRQLYFNKAFFGCVGIDLAQQTVCSTEMQSISMKRIALQQAEHSYLLLDSSKFGSKGLMRVCETSQFEAVICDRYTGPAENRPANLLSVEEESQQS